MHQRCRERFGPKGNKLLPVSQHGVGMEARMPVCRALEDIGGASSTFALSILGKRS
jgi:hypothetical protein